MTKDYDLVVLGGGTGGYTAAIRAAQLGMSVAIVEYEKLGGTCLHHGCIPSKALLKSAEMFRNMKLATNFGVEISDATFNMEQAQSRKKSIIDTLHTGVQGLMKKHKIDVFHGFGRILGPSIFSPMPGTISVEYENGEENTMIIPKYVLIATGSKPSQLPNLECDGKYIMHTDHALELNELPNTLTIIGGGVIGIEWASMMIDLGVKVTVIEYAEEILPTEDKEIVNEVKKQLTKRGVVFHTGAKIIPDKTDITDNVVTVRFEKGENTETISSEKLLVSVGREANIDQIGITNTAIQVHNGFIQTNAMFQTKESHIYAIGDCIGGMQLAHMAAKEGKTAVEHMANQKPVPWNTWQVPACIYSHPEIAHIGLTEQQAKEQGYTCKIGKMPFQANGKAYVEGDVSGFVKVITDEQSHDILGIHMVGPHVTELISEASLATLLDATAWEIGETIHAHPTLSETIGEAALAVEKLNIHG